MTEAERNDALADIKSFTKEELEVTLKALNVASAIKAEFVGVSEDRVEDLADLAVEFALDSTKPDFSEEIEMVKAELASRSN